MNADSKGGIEYHHNWTEGGRAGKPGKLARRGRRGFTVVRPRLKAIPNFTIYTGEGHADCTGSRTGDRGAHPRFGLLFTAGHSRPESSFLRRTIAWVSRIMRILLLESIRDLRLVYRRRCREITEDGGEARVSLPHSLVKSGPRMRAR